MAEVITAGQWEAAREAVRDCGDRFAELVLSVAPDAMATADWTVADTAAHVTAIAQWDTALVGSEDPPYPWNVLTDQIRTTTVDTIDVLNDRTMEQLSERDAAVLVGQLRAHIDDVLRISADLDPDRAVDWLGGSRLPLAGLLAHLTNELQIHGHDIARATRSRWLLSQEYAAQFTDLFLVGLARHDGGKLLHRDGVSNDRRVAAEFRSRYTTPVTLVVERGRVAGIGLDGTADVRLRFEPVAFNLMMFGRISGARAALTGKVMVGGPRPWLLPTFLRTFRCPN